VAQVFKETLDLGTVAAALERGILAAGFEPLVLGASDGGDGLLDALSPEIRRTTRHVVAGPLGASVEVSAGWLDPETAVVESRLVCGLSLLGAGERDPERTTTRGVGELLDALIGLGARRIIVGLGGSATMDGGAGMARAWGWEFLDSSGRHVPEGGGGLEHVARVRPGRRPNAGITGLMDVRHVLAGPAGAIQFAEQKGATPEIAAALDRGLRKLAAVVDSGGALSRRSGAGAAGGLGFGLMAFAGAELVAGATWMLDRLRFDSLLAGARAVVVGEGRFDATSLGGKLAGEVLARAAARGVPSVLAAPSVTVTPPGRVVIETGGGVWSAAELGRRVEAGLRRMVSLSSR
jgi:glycerate kinase